MGRKNDTPTIRNSVVAYFEKTQIAVCSHYCIECGRKHPHQLGFILDCKFADFCIDWFNVNSVCNTMQSTNKIETRYKVYRWLV